MSAASDGACAIPPEIYDIAFGWDPQPEVQRLLLLAREFDGAPAPASALELGCGTGRLLAALEPHVERLAGVELSAEMAALARQRTRATILTADMTALALGERFDLIYSSANTIRHLYGRDALGRLWRGVAAHLNPGGVFVADLELGRAFVRESVGRPAHWSSARGEDAVDAFWSVTADVDPQTDCCEIEWKFVHRRGGARRTWTQSFPLRVFDAAEFLGTARTEGLESCGLFELRDPYMFPRDAGDAEGRFLAVLRSPRPENARG